MSRHRNKLEARREIGEALPQGEHVVVIHSNDETHIGSGQRIVLARVGWKWVRIKNFGDWLEDRPKCPFHRIRRSIFNQIFKEVLEV